MRIIVSDTSCFIDLKKGDLLRAFFELPFSFAMPDTLFEGELLSLSDNEKAELVELGLEVMELTGESVDRASGYFNRHRPLKLNDCFALVLAENIEDSILFTGDGPLRAVASEKVEVHGVLWATDLLEEHEIVPLARLHNALTIFRDDILVFLPEDELNKRIRRLTRLIG